MIDESFLINTLTSLVQINSVNPALEPDGAGEQELGLYINDLLESLGIESSVNPLGPNRCNVVGILKGSGKGKSLMLNAHMDTVGIKGMENPFAAISNNGKLYGRGAYDMKASIAAMLAMTKAIKEQNIVLGGDIILAFVADEEFESIGTKQLTENYATDAAIVTEPTNLDICLAHRGFGIYEITTIGKTAHGGNYNKGIDANSMMGLLLAELNNLTKKLLDKKTDPLLGHASLHVPLIQGGQSLFIYAEECTIKVERRTLPGETEEGVLKELENIIEDLAKKEENFKAIIHPVMWREPYKISQKSTIVQTLQKCANNVLGLQPAYIGHSWWEDSGLIGKSGTETVIIGPKGGGIHEHTEWVDIQSVIDLSKILLRTATKYCCG